MDSDLTSVSRRTFLKLTTLSGAGLALGISLPTPSPAKGDGDVPLGAWLRIASNGETTICVSRAEMGQGVDTALPMLVAEELDVEWSRVRTQWAPLDPVYAPRITYGSQSVNLMWTRLRIVGATARHMLVQAAARLWEVEPDQCRTGKGRVIHQHSGREADYGSLAPLAACLPIPRRVRLKNPSEFILVGKPVERTGVREKATGRAEYGWDARPPGDLVAVAAYAPVIGGALKSFDADSALSVPGVRYVVPLTFSLSEAHRRPWGYLRESPNAAPDTASTSPQKRSSDALSVPREVPPGINGLAVVAVDTWSAVQGREALVAEWEPGPNAGLDSRALADVFAEWTLQENGEILVDKNDVGTTKPEVVKTVRAVYHLPFLAHVTPEPLSCIADVRKDQAEFQVAAQDPAGFRKAASAWTGLPEESVRLQTVAMGGGFGRRLSPDCLIEAAQISRSIGRPVKLCRLREDDLQEDCFRPMSCHRMSAEIGVDGLPISWDHRLAGCGTYTTLALGVDDVPYDIPIKSVRLFQKSFFPFLRLGPHRGVGYVPTAFAIECFLDEIALAGGLDPLTLRLRLLSRSRIYREVLELAAHRSGWGKTPSLGTHRGIALQANGNGAIVAQVAELSIEQGRELRIHRIVCAVYCGRTIHPGIVESQITGGILFGLSAALNEQVTIKHGRVRQGNFDDYPLLRMNRVPRVEVHILPSGNQPCGVGELGVPPVAPAVANAVLSATGKPLRSLPFRIPGT